MFKQSINVVFIILQVLLPKHFLSRLIAKVAESRISWLKDFLIRLAIDVFDINIDEALSPHAKDYENFNAFFTRELKEGCRPVDQSKKSFVSPSDGVVSQFGKIEHGLLIQAKGKYYALEALLGGNKTLSETFINGEFATIYLSPRDYHRVHMPCSGKLTHSIYVPGELFSVNKTTADNINGLFARNERLINIFETDQGPMASILVGAMLVAGIETVWAGHVVPPKAAMNTFELRQEQLIELKKGEEMGRFKFGSTVILLFPEKTIRWEENVQLESFLKMGEKIGTFI